MKIITAIGPESTGKSTLCRELADTYRCLWVPEYARDFLLSHGNRYNFEDLLAIARGQWTLQQQYEAEARRRQDPYLFVDTDQYVMKVWCEFVFGRCHPWILDRIPEQQTALYLLCNTDLPWVRDELREYPDLESRQTLFYMYHDILVHQSRPWTEIRGQAGARTPQALAFIRETFET